MNSEPLPQQRQQAADTFDIQLREFQGELDEAVLELDRHYGELKDAAAQRLGQPFNATDYPESLAGLFRIEWDFPSIEPRDNLQQLNARSNDQLDDS